MLIVEVRRGGGPSDTARGMPELTLRGGERAMEGGYGPAGTAKGGRHAE